MNAKITPPSHLDTMDIAVISGGFAILRLTISPVYSKFFTASTMAKGTEIVARLSHAITDQLGQRSQQSISIEATCWPVYLQNFYASTLPHVSPFRLANIT